MMACKACGAEHNPLWRCDDGRIERNHPVTISNHDVTTNLVERNHPVTTKVVTVTTPTVTRNQCQDCITKDALIASLYDQLAAKVESEPKAKRNRAEYMRQYRARTNTGSAAVKQANA